MPQYYQNQERAAPNQQRPINGGSVRLARERAEALSQRQMTGQEQPTYARGFSTMQNDGRNYASGTMNRPPLNTGTRSQNTQNVRPPPPVWAPTHYSSGNDMATSSTEDLTITPNKQRGRGELAQDFRFPQVPKSMNPSPYSARKNQGPPMRQQAPPQRSPGSPAWPLPKPSRAPTGEIPTSATQGIPSPITPRQTANPYERESVYNRPSEPGTPPAPHGVVRTASQGKRAKPVLTTIRHPEIREERTEPMSPRADTINALSAAIAAGMAPSSRPQTPQTQAIPLSVRMPFADESPPQSPIDEKLGLEPPRVFGGSPVATSDSGTSAHSYNPLLSKDPRPGMSDKIPSSRRPPRLNIEAVREAESRGSTTSLSDLIRRATKLASNLDRGKTASRLGMLDMFNAGEKASKHTSGSISDMLSAFPEPGMTPTSARNHDPRNPPGSSHLRDGEYAPHDSRNFKPDKQGRRCCGMSLAAFFVVMFILVILIAAAVLVPIFLIVIPRMQNASTGLAHCSTSHVCRNMGISVVNNNECSCVCTNGYTGDKCQMPLEAECSTTDVTIYGAIYDGATAGSSLPDVLSGAGKNFSIPLNSTALLSLFAANNLSCITENSLVSFNVQTQNQKRFLPIHIPLPMDTPSIQTLKARIPQPSTVASTDGIVYAASSTSTTGPSSTASSDTQSASASSPSSSSSPVSDKTLSFAQVVVLYVFEQSTTLSIAVNAQQTMQSYLASVGGDANGTLAVGYKDMQISADFGNFEIIWGNGTSVGGSKERVRRT